MMYSALILSDDERTFDDLKDELEAGGGFIANQSGAGQQVIETFIALKPDIVLVDLRAFDIEELVTLRTYRSLEPTVKIAAFGADDRRPVVSFAMQTGLFCQFIENLDPQDIVRRIASLLK